MIIYKVTNKENNKSYIGKTVQTLRQRQTDHINNAFNHNSKTYFHNALRKHGKELFVWEILYECKNIDNLNQKEIYYINLYQSFMIKGYNMTKGGEGGDTTSNHPNKKEIYKNISKRMKGEKNHRYGKPGTFLGKNHTNKAIIKMRKSKEGKHIGKNNPNWKNRKYICPKCSNDMYPGSKMCRSCWEKYIVGDKNPAYGKTFTQKKIECPFCGKVGGEGNMKRYHFDNCKEKK
jgi:group I intron endonuclease